jgi:hypothetical protein
MRCSRGHGARLVRVLILIAGVLTYSAASAAEVMVRQLEDNQFEFILTSSTRLTESEAQAHIANVAAGVCNGLTPVLGKYRFEAREAIGGDAGSSEPDTFRFAQEVFCVHGAATPTEQRRPTLSTPEESHRVQDEIRLKSEEYFRLIAMKRVDEAYAQVSAFRMNTDETNWKNNKLAFQVTAGEPLQISIVKVTVYDNPVEAPEPGLYVAADFSNVYENVPIHCGYLMWFRSIGGSFRITREETGHVTAEQLKTIPSDQLPEIKRMLRCVAP